MNCRALSLSCQSCNSCPKPRASMVGGSLQRLVGRLLMPVMLNAHLVEVIVHTPTPRVCIGDRRGLPSFDPGIGQSGSWSSPFTSPPR
jgi:hypothetical protein